MLCQKVAGLPVVVLVYTTSANQIRANKSKFPKIVEIRSQTLAWKTTCNFATKGDTEKPKGVPLGPRTGGITDTHNNRHGESDGCAVNSHTTSTPMAQRPYSQSEQGWQTPTLFMPPPSSIQAPQDQQNPSYHTLSSFQPAGGGGGGTWSDYDHSVGRRGVRAAEEGGPGASSLRMHPNMHRGLLAEMNAGVRLHPVAPQPPNPI